MEIPIPIDPPYVEVDPPQPVPETEPQLQEDLWRYRFPWVKTAVSASPFDHSLAIENRTGHLWMLWHRYHALGSVAPEESRAVRLVKSGLLTARQFPAPAGAEHILLDLDPSIARVAIDDASGGEGFFYFTVIELSPEMSEPPEDVRLPITVRIEALGLSARTEDVLKRLGITTADVLAGLGASAVLSLPGLRPKDRKELIRVLAELDIL